MHAQKASNYKHVITLIYTSAIAEANFDYEIRCVYRHQRNRNPHLNIKNRNSIVRISKICGRYFHNGHFLPLWQHRCHAEQRLRVIGLTLCMKSVCTSDVPNWYNNRTKGPLLFSLATHYAFLDSI